MKILITGSCGFIGCNIALKAMEQGHEIIGFDNLSRLGVEYNLVELNKNNHFFLIRGDVRNHSDFKKIPEVEAIIHLAAQPGISWSITNPRYDFEVNALGTLNILEFARERSELPVIYASTNKCYSEEINEISMREGDTRYYWTDDKYKNGIPESFPVDSAGKHPHSPYGVSKLAGDLLMQEYYHIYGVPTVVNRMSCIAGQWQQGCEDQGWLAWFVFVKMFDSVLTIYGDGKQVRDVLNVGELANLYLQQLSDIDTYKGNVYNIGGGPENTYSLLEAMAHLVELDGRDFRIVYKERRLADHIIYISSLKKIEKHWTPTISPRETIDGVWNWASTHRKAVWKVFLETVARR